MLIFMLISIAITVMLVMVEEHRKHRDWRANWEDGNSGIAGRMALLS